MKIKHKLKRKIVSKIVLVAILTVLFVAALICNNFIPRGFADYYGKKIFPVISSFFQSLNMFFQHSVSENLTVILVPLLIIGFIAWLVILIKKFLSRGALKYLYKSYRNLVIIGLIAAILFQLMHGINYRRTDVEEELDLVTTEELTFEQYCAALRWAYMGMIEARSHLGEDYNGVAHMQNSFENSATYACSLLDAFCDEYDIPLSENYLRAKPVSLSHYWSYTYIVGMYDPFLGEANLNTDYMSVTDFPLTICHELCHAKGYASETDCNLLAALACCSSTRADFRYAGYYDIFWSIYPIAEEYGEAIGEVVPAYYATSEMDPVYRDMRASVNYWCNIDAEVDALYERFGIDVTEVSNNANDAFLKSNGEEGVQSYNVPDSIYVRFYLTYVEGAGDA